MDSGLAWPVSSEISSGSKSSRSAWMTVLRPLEFVNLPSREAMDAILCGFALPMYFYQLEPSCTRHWILDCQLDSGRNFQEQLSALRTMANVLDKCSVRISLSTIRPPNLVVILSRPFCRSRFRLPGGSWFVALCIRCTALSR